MRASERFECAFETHEAYEQTADGFRLTTTTLDVHAAAVETDEREGGDPTSGAEAESDAAASAESSPPGAVACVACEVTVRAPMLSTVAEEAVGSTVESGWFDTYALRLEDAPGVVREDVTIEHALRSVDGNAVATLRFEWPDAGRVPDLAKSLAEYVEGTYVEGIVPGYEYGDPVASMLAEATQGEGGERGGTPL